MTAKLLRMMVTHRSMTRALVSSQLRRLAQKKLSLRKAPEKEALHLRCVICVYIVHIYIYGRKGGREREREREREKA